MCWDHLIEAEQQETSIQEKDAVLEDADLLESLRLVAEPA